jgi:hypothetical protein
MMRSAIRGAVGCRRSQHATGIHPKHLVSLASLLAFTCFATSLSSAQSPLAGAVVGTFELAAPHVSSFILHGTLPVPQATFPRADGKLPFSIRDFDGTIVDAQIEPVTWYPDEQSDGADVIELTARVHLAPGTQPGTHVQYAVVQALHDPSSFAKNSAVQTLFSTPNAVTIRTRDIFGHVYTADLLSGSDGTKILRSGAFREQRRFYQYMRPNTTSYGAPTGALRRMMAVHSYVSAWNGEDVVSLDLRIHNGTSGHDQADPIDDPQDRLYFDQLEIVVPQGWTLTPDVLDKGWGAPVTQGSTVVYPIVKALSGGKLNLLPQQAQFQRRLVLAPASSAAIASSVVTEEWQAFCQPGGSGNTGLYSWWNRQTARYFPQHHVLPSFDYMGKSQTLNKLKTEWTSDYNWLTSGLPKGSYPFYVGQLGWMYPFGTKYGGMTGGSDIYLYDGVLTAWAASNEGYRHSQLYHRMYTDRHPVVLYDKNGDPTTVEDWVVHGSQFDYVDMQFYLKLLGGNDPFGLTVAPQFQILAAIAQAKQPGYEADMLGYAPIDIQHHIRWLRSPKVLTWLGNDALAKDDLLMEAELLRLSYLNLPYNNSGAFLPSSMAFDIDAVQHNGGVGFACGRDEAWSVDGVCAAYSISGPQWRAVRRPWFDAFTALVRLGQSDCNGFIMRLKTNKDFNGQYYVRRSTETAMIDQALLSMINTVYQGVDPKRTASLQYVMTKELYALASPPSWSNGFKGPYSSIAVAPLSGAPYCGTSPAVATDADKFQCWNSFAYGYELTNDPMFLQRAAQMSGASSMANLLHAQENMNFGNHENRAGLIGLAQAIWGP